MKGFKFFHLLPFSLVLFFIFALYLDFLALHYLTINKILTPPVASPRSTHYPVLGAFSPPDLSAQAALVMDDDSKVILYSKNPSLRFSTASTAKIMTALVALDFYSMEDELTIQSEYAEPFVVGFKKGERFRFSNLLYALLLPSANDAALALAQNYPGGEEAFVGRMNAVTRGLHLINTHFGDAAGLLDDQDYTTALDLARLASYALKNKEFARVVSTKIKAFSNRDGTKSYSIVNRNKLLGISGIDGIKTGYTEEAGGVLVTSAIKNGHRLIMVVMGSSDRFLDTTKLLDVVSEKIIYLPIRP